MSDEFYLLIHGERRPGAGHRMRPVVNPADESVVGQLPIAAAQDLDDALKSSRAGFEQWSRLSAAARAATLRDCAHALKNRIDELARRTTLDQGKPLDESRGEALFAPEIFEWYAAEGQRAYGRIVPGHQPGQRQLVFKEPVGPVAAMTPWNFPVGTPAGKLAAALAAGCSVILKASEVTPGGAVELVQCLHDAGLPRGVVNLVFGVPDEISRHLLASDTVRAVHFTGSIPVGRHLAALAAQNLQRCVLELGGHAPVIVCEDVDIDRVASMTAATKFYNAGQVCVSPSRFFVHRSKYDRFVSALADAAARLRVGNGADPATNMGPLAHAGRLEFIESIVADAREKGSEIVAGGSRIGSRGYFFGPTVLANVPDDCRIMSEEPFGPVAAIQPFDDLDAVIEKANSLPYGLASMAFTNSRSTAERLARHLQSGMVAINSYRLGYAETPFGGVKQSGYGSEQGIEGLDALLTTKFVSENNLQ